MKICIPVEADKGLESIVYSHFGSAPFFMFYYLENEEIRMIKNNDFYDAHGMCQPLKAFKDEDVDSILVGGIGTKALKKLNDQGIKAYKAVAGTAAWNIELLKENQLREFTVESSCIDHKCRH